MSDFDDSGADFFGAVGSAVRGVARALGRDPASAILFRGDPPELEVVRDAGLPEDVRGSLTDAAGRHLAWTVRQAGHPLRIEAEHLPGEARDLAAALRANGIGALAAYPLFGESELVGCLLFPADPGAGVSPSGESWKAACRAPAALQVAAGAAVLRTILQEDRRRPLALADGVLVIDRWERVLFADGVVREGPAWSGGDLFGRTLSSLPGGTSLGGVQLSRPGSLTWEDHLLSPVEGHEIPVAVSALPGRLVDGRLDGSRVLLVRTLGAAGREAGATSPALTLGLRVAHGVDELEWSLLARDAESAAEGASPVLAAFLREVARAREVVRSALDAAMDEGHRDRVDFNALLLGILDSLRPELASQGIPVVTSLQPRLPAVTGDAVAVLRCLYALVGRARASLRAGCGGTLTVGTWVDEGWVGAVVADDGPATEAARAPSDVEAAAGTPAAATGLGEVEAVARRHGGHLRVQRRFRVWNEYTLILPAERRLRRPSPHAPSPTKTSGARGHALQVLVVDDNEALRSVLRRYLERRGHAVTEAGDAEEALGMVGSRSFDRIIVDINMPGKSGPEFYTCLGDVAPTLRSRTLFMTGGFLEDATERFLVEAGRPAIQKPFDLAELVRTVEGAA